jgi:hypothetical protein
MKSTPSRVTLGFFVFISLIVAAGLRAAQVVIAERLESDSYIIQFGNFNVTAGEKTSTSYGVTDTVGQSFAGPFGQYGSSTYFVGAGFQYIYQTKPFRFTISDLDINLGELTSGVFSTDSNVLTITTGGAEGYTVYAYEIHPLRRSSGSVIIPDTTCDSGSCTHTTAGVWNSSNAYGFGFGAAGATVPADFSTSSHFRQFADDEAGEPMQPVMSSTNIGEADTATITYKANISGTQAAGDYQTAVVYVAVPGY